MPTSPEFRKKRQDLIVRYVRNRGGVIVGPGYQALRAPMSIRCHRSHLFTIKPRELLRGAWCQKCKALPRQLTQLRRARELARRRGGKCLSKHYKNAREPMDWECIDGHTWQASFDSVSSKKTWCAECARTINSQKKKRWWRNRRKLLHQIGKG